MASCTEVMVGLPTPLHLLPEYQDARAARSIAYSEIYYIRFIKELLFYNAMNDLADAWAEEDYTAYNYTIGKMLETWTDQNRFF